MREVKVREACLCMARVCLACQCAAFCGHAAFVCVCVCGLRYVGQSCVRSPVTCRVGVRVGVVRGVYVRGSVMRPSVCLACVCVCAACVMRPMCVRGLRMYGRVRFVGTCPQ